MISADRLDELETLRPPDDIPDDARVTLPARDVRDLVRLVAVARVALSWYAQFESAVRFVDHAPLMIAVNEMGSNP